MVVVKTGGWKIERKKYDEEWHYSLFGWEGEGERKVVQPTSFLSPFKIQSLQIGEKIGVKSEKKYLYKTTLSLLTFFFFPFVPLLFCFLFFFSYLFFLSLGSSSFPSFFFLNFYFYYFFKEKTFGWFLMLFFEMSTFIYTQEIWW